MNPTTKDREDDQRFTGLDGVLSTLTNETSRSRSFNVKTSQFKAVGSAGAVRFQISGDVPTDVVHPTHWSFGQVCGAADAPSMFLRDLPGALAADCINFGLKSREQDLGLYVMKANGGPGAPWTLRAATAPSYGRIMSTELVQTIIDLGGPWQVPTPLKGGAKGEQTTHTISDRDVFLFLVDETNPIEVGKRLFYRGFYVWNSEVGSRSIGLRTFLYSAICSNRMVMGMRKSEVTRISHTAKAPEKWKETLRPVLESYTAGDTTAGIVATIKKAQAAKIGGGDPVVVREFLHRRRISLPNIDAMLKQHLQDEGRPVVTRWDAAQAITAWARSNPHSNRRISLERRAGAILETA